MLVCIGFQGLFHYCFATLFQLSLTVLFHYRSILVFSLIIIDMISSNRRFYFFLKLSWSTGLLPSLVFPPSFSHYVFVSFWLFGFHSPLLSKSLLISFPSITKMFQFIEFCSEFWSFLLGSFPIFQCSFSPLLEVMLSSTFLFLTFHFFYDLSSKIV